MAMRTADGGDIFRIPRVMGPENEARIPTPIRFSFPAALERSLSSPVLSISPLTIRTVADSSGKAAA